MKRAFMCGFMRRIPARHGKNQDRALNVRYRTELIYFEEDNSSVLNEIETRRNKMSIGLILLIVLVLALVGVIPTWGHSSTWGYGPSGGIGLVLLIVLILVVMGKI